MAFIQKLMFEASGKLSLLLLLSLFLVCTAAPYEDSSSLEDISSSLSSFQDMSKRSGGNPFLRIFNSNGVPEDKRALSLFAHWKPQYGYKPDNFQAINTRSDIVTRGGSSHARPLGQPLRWG